MLLSVTDRLLLLGLLPEQGSILTLRVVREARQALELTPEEIVAFEVSHDGPNVRWNPDKAVEVDIELSDPAIGLARETIQKWNTEQRLTANHIPLWEKLVESPAAA